MANTSEALGLVKTLASVAARIHSGERLETTLQAVADAVVDNLGFGIAVVNYRRTDGCFETVAVSGSQEAADALLGTTLTDEQMQDELAASVAWGALRFVPHDGLPDYDHQFSYVPDIPVSDDPDAWHPLDALFAPLYAADGRLLGLLSVDVPNDGRRPGQGQRELLEAFAVHAGLAIAAAEVTAQLRRDASELLREQVRLKASEEAFRLVFEGSATGLAVVAIAQEDHGRLLQVNDALCQALLQPRETLLKMRLGDIITGTDSVNFAQRTTRVIAGLSSMAVGDYRVHRGDGSTTWLSVKASAVRSDPAGRPLLLLSAEDAGDRIARQQTLEWDAEHDELTGSANRRLLVHRLDTAIARAREHDRSSALLFCDLDGFKRVNDRHGHSVGDAVLRTVADRMREQVRSRDTVARLGGDEFVILAEDLDRPDAEQLADRVRASVREPFAATSDLAIDVSIGVVMITPAATGAAQALAEADDAMYRDKARHSAPR